MPTIQANGLTIAYEVEGAGPPLIALHGATTSGRADFAALLPSLTTAFLVHLPDARGHGATRWDVETGGFEERWLVDDLEAFLDGLGIESAHFFGFSMGAMTALGFAARWPARVRTLAVVGMTPDREPRASVLRRLMDPDRIEREEPGWAAELAERHDPVQGPGAWRHLLPAIAADVARQTLLTAAELHAIDAPTLIACGDRDPFAPVDQAFRLARQVRDGRLVVLPHCGHQVLIGQPEVFRAALGDFYRSTQAVAERRAAARGEGIR